ncbi:MAG TPA: acyl-CoA dehydrogenase family protein, partial [Longimicrobium sp.]|nr:acyl-CoA dehydrogenase family protein [Longimicrobium sp.]
MNDLAAFLAAPAADAGLRMELGPAQQAARAAFAAYVAEHVAPHAGRWDRDASTPRDAVDRLAATG